jgi:hypothetical protein
MCAYFLEIQKWSGSRVVNVFASQPRDHGFELYSDQDHESKFDTSTDKFQAATRKYFSKLRTIEVELMCLNLVIPNITPNKQHRCLRVDRNTNIYMYTNY